MTLQNLLRTGQLQPFSPTRGSIAKLLKAAHERLSDARQTNISNSTRFDAAYMSIVEPSQAALMANGFRLSSAQGHHATAIQTLPKSVGLENSRIAGLDALRKQRHLVDYDGDPVPNRMLCDLSA